MRPAIEPQGVAWPDATADRILDEIAATYGLTPGHPGAVREHVAKALMLRRDALAAWAGMDRSASEKWLAGGGLDELAHELVKWVNRRGEDHRPFFAVNAVPVKVEIWTRAALALQAAGVATRGVDIRASARTVWLGTSMMRASVGAADIAEVPWDAVLYTVHIMEGAVRILESAEGRTELATELNRMREALDVAADKVEAGP